MTLQHQRLGIAECLRAVREVFEADINEALLLRAMTYFDDADREAPLPGEGKSDWNMVKSFFVARAGDLLVPPTTALAIQRLRVDVTDETGTDETGAVM